MTCYLSSAFIINRLRFCALKTLRRHPHKGKETSISDAISEEDISHIEKPRVPRHATHQGLSCDMSLFLCVLETLGGVTRKNKQQRNRQMAHFQTPFLTKILMISNN